MKTDRETVMTAKYLHEAFLYMNGDLYWKERPLHHFKNFKGRNIFNSRQAYTKAGSLNHGYVRVRLSCGVTSAHRIIFLMHHGYLPDEIDHIDGNPGNNAINNLRAATHAENMKNMNRSSANTSGRKGVYSHKATGKWIASIRVKGRQTHLGLHSRFEDACRAREVAEKLYYGNFANGR